MQLFCRQFFPAPRNTYPQVSLELMYCQSLPLHFTSQYKENIAKIKKSFGKRNINEKLLEDFIQ